MAVPFKVETGTGADPDANSYVAIDAANNYHEGGLYTTEWNAADPDQKKRALITATRTIDNNCAFRGYRKLIGQPLAWPRVRARNDDYFGGDRALEGGMNILLTSLPYYDENSIPAVLAQATADLALALLRADRTKDDPAKGIDSLSVGSGAVALSFNSLDRARPLPDELRRKLACLVVSFRGSGSGTKRVVRTL